mgnify:CR=1 FL=1
MPSGPSSRSDMEIELSKLSTPRIFLVRMLVFLVLCALVMVGAAVALTRNARIGWNDAAFGALVAAFPNTGFMGVPLLVALLGAQSAGPAIVTIVVDMVITSSLCIALSRLDGAGTHGVGVALGRGVNDGVALGVSVGEGVAEGV